MVRSLTLIVLAMLSGTQAKTTAPIATNSGPIAITSDDRFIWVVNRDNNTVLVIKVADDANIKIAEIKVGVEPRCVAITPDDRKVFVTDMVDGTVSVIDAKKLYVAHTSHVGTEPFGCAVTPDGRKLYVANFDSDNVSVINARFELVIKTIKNVGPKPRGIAIVGPSAALAISRMTSSSSSSSEMMDATRTMMRMTTALAKRMFAQRRRISRATEQTTRLH
jgi:YVTN family beta-propeller protein